MSDVPRVAVGAAIIYDKQGKILLCKRGNGGTAAHKWEFPGGKRKPEETLEQCVVRECKEELGVDLEVDGLYDAFIQEESDRQLDFTFFTAHISHGKVRALVHDDLVWAEPAKLLVFDLAAADKRVAQTLAEGGSAQVAVVGGGAAGIVAAIEAARTGATVTLLEAKGRVGQSILATGNGRCNYTNSNIIGETSAEMYTNSAFVRNLLGMHPSSWVIDRFRRIGVMPAQDMPEGRVYPRTHSAASVLEALRMELAHLGVRELCGFEVEEVEQLKQDEGEMGARPRFALTGKDGRRLTANAVVVATGGGSRLLEQLGHRVTDMTPALCALETNTDPIKGLDGVRVQCEVSLWKNREAPKGKKKRAKAASATQELNDLGPLLVAREAGELLFRGYGVSGIVIFDLSRFVQQDMWLSIDLVPELSEEQLVEELATRRERMGWRTAEQLLLGMLRRSVADAVLRRAGIAVNAPVASIDLGYLAQCIKHFSLAIKGLANTDHAQVTRGGADMRDFVVTTLGSRHVRGLYAAGEALDVDGPCGGFNLHWAWVSGSVAGSCAGQYAQGEQPNSLDELEAEKTSPLRPMTTEDPARPWGAVDATMVMQPAELAQEQKHAQKSSKNAKGKKKRKHASVSGTQQGDPIASAAFELSAPSTQPETGALPERRLSPELIPEPESSGSFAPNVLTEKRPDPEVRDPFEPRPYEEVFAEDIAREEGLRSPEQVDMSGDE